MYTMDRDKAPKRPVISSLAGALTEVQTWLAANQLQRLEDGDGLSWDLDLKVEQIPAPRDPRAVLWQAKALLTAKVDGAQLVATGTLDAKDDERLLSIIGDDRIELKMRPLIYTAPSEEGLRSMVAEALPRLKMTFAQSSLTEVKRGLVGRYVDHRCSFGG